MIQENDKGKFLLALNDGSSFIDLSSMFEKADVDNDAPRGARCITTNISQEDMEKLRKIKADEFSLGLNS